MHQQSIWMPPHPDYQCPPPSSPIFMPYALSATTIPIYPGLGQAPNNAGLHTQWGIIKYKKSGK